MNNRQTMNVNRAALVLIIFAMLITTPAVTIIILGAVEPYPIRYNNSPFPVDPVAVEQGQPLTLSVTRCFDNPISPRPLVYSFTTTLVSRDGLREQVLQGSTHSSSAYGCEAVTVQRTVPATVTPGHYYLTGTTVAFGRFRLAPVILTWESQPFMVVERTTPAGGEGNGS